MGRNGDGTMVRFQRALVFFGGEERWIWGGDEEVKSLRDGMEV